MCGICRNAPSPNLMCIYTHAIGNFISNLITCDFYWVIAKVSVTRGSGGFFMAE